MRRRRHPLFTRVSLLSLGVVVVLALAMGYALSSLLTRAVSEWEWQNTAALVRREVQIAGLARIFTHPGGREERQRWGAEFQRALTTLPEFARVKVWSRDAEVLWSDEPDLIGQRFPNNDELRRALAGDVEVEIEAVNKSEQKYERLTFKTLAEIYVPILGGDGRVLGVVEVYKTPERLLGTIRTGRFVIWAISLSGGALLYAVLLPLFTQVYRRQVEEETLRVHAARLESEVEQRTEQFMQAQKMQAVGLLAGGIAHDFNNLLTVIIGRTEVLCGRLAADTPVRRDAALILTAAERAATLTKQLLAFSRKQILERRVVDVNAVVSDMSQMLRQLIGENITVVVTLAPDACCVHADRAQLEQMILNLVVNARDAMPNGGQLILATGHVERETASDDGASPDPGHYIELVVSDTGAGIDPAMQARIFEPFFTTKEAGKGTGLGLSMVYGVVKQHDGHVTVDSAVGRGTTFRILLPRIDVTARTAMMSSVPASRGSETILVAEDEPEVRALARDILVQQGYTVLVAEDGAAALRVAEARSGSIELLLTDIVMPKLSGWELARRATALHPEAKVLYMTGYTEIPPRPSSRVLLKPFTPYALAQAVRETLDSPHPPPAAYVIR
jgi:two-component system cell cycle sensor histidine kinase/response regulator CckA